MNDVAEIKKSRGNRRNRSIQKSKRIVRRIVENNLIRKVSFDDYRVRVRDVYDGPRGAILATASMLSLHLPLGERILKQREFDLRGFSRILDVGSGAGQLAQHVVKYCDADAKIVCCDLSCEMLRRARTRLARMSKRRSMPRFVTADLTALPFEDKSFDCVSCGYVLEHLPDPRAGLAEVARVLRPGGHVLLLTTEDTFAGALTSRFWCCRTYNRRELWRTCDQLGLSWKKEIWFTDVHKALRAGGIVVDIEKVEKAVPSIQ